MTYQEASCCLDVSDSDISVPFGSAPSRGEEELGEREGATAAGKELVDSGKRHTKVPGVIYLSRVPPFMKPHKLKHLLSPYGTVGRIYLRPEGMYLPFWCLVTDVFCA